ncbi:hypothetical protein B0H66DRAFT_485056 [Apodospora peruviana]|uniref:NACHT domain-containing protein n=1 Tax=Apodospora peruviana TaxID=516989 RepID=A0AAE0HU56_9PEZI|nr:hypothetical protein B0H66DRAFT_485056 [Apodospora peruviana]
MDFIWRTRKTLRSRRNTEARWPAPREAGRIDPPIQPLREKINRITHELEIQDSKYAFTSKIWPSLRDEYDIMREGLEKLCKNALGSKNIKSQVQSRTKTADSIKASLDRREKVLPKHQKQFENFSEIFNAIHDLVGVRIILEYPDDIQKAIRFIEETFQKERDPVVFQFDREVGQHWKTWFGAYQTLNYRLRLKNDKSETLSQFRGVLFEIQLTTIAEHLYNKFAHPLLYKDSGGTLSRQDEMVIDMSHGISLCYSLCLMYMKEKLGKDSDKIQDKDILLAETNSFHQNLTRETSFDTFANPEGLATAIDIPPEAYKSAADLREWIDGKINDILTEVRSTSQTIREAVLSKLPVAEGAAFDSHAEEHNARCHPDTRTELLSQIQNWANDSQAENIFWLNGMAGTGKSTISRTVAKSFADSGLLGASFFFKRGEGDRGKAARVFPTIASQLVCTIPTLAPYVRKAIDTNPAVPTKVLRDQFEELVRKPLNCIQYTTTLVIVIDALDECDGDNDVRNIISILARAHTQPSGRLRVFITSRPELPIRLGFKDVRGRYQGLALHQVPEPIVEQDIFTFLEYELARIRNESNSQALEGLELPLDWPGNHVIRTLAQMAVPLFIFAATVCRFIGDRCSDPADQLEKVLQYQMKTHDSELDKLNATYLPVLNQLIIGRNNPQKNRLLAEFRNVVGPIVLLAEPLSVSSLAQLLNFSPKAIHSKLNSLHSVLDVPSQLDAPVRLFHLSFRDFLVDPTKSTTNDFWIDETKYHKTLADRCLQVINPHLRRDICNLQMPGKLRSEVDQRTIDTALPPEIQYACQYWIHHLKESRGSVQDWGLVHSFLRSHLLHWLEALSLIGRISESIGMVDDLLALSVYAVEISGFLRDIRRFILSSRSIIDIAPLQVYASALVFSPTHSITRDIFKHEIPKWITSGPIVEENWNACRQTLEGHSHRVSSVAFSPDSNLVVSGSGDNTVKIWDVATGHCTQTLEGHSHSVGSVASVSSVAFSPDSNLVTLEGHSGSVRSVAKIPYRLEYGIVDNKWITRGSENWLWLPPGCRGTCSAVAASTIAIGCLSGHVLIITVATDNYN